MEYRRDEEFDIISYGKRDRQPERAHGSQVRTSRQRQKNIASNRGERQRDYDTNNRARELRRKKRRRKVFIARFVCAFFICIFVGSVAMGICSVLLKREATGGKAEELRTVVGSWFQKGKDWNMEDMITMLEQKGISCTQDFLTINEYSRPAEELKKVKNIFVHYTANPGTSAAQNRSYFENLAETHETSASAHFIIGYEGEIVQCIPLDEIAYAVAGRNQDSISIECCYVNENGQFTEKTYETLVQFSALLLEKYGLKAEDLRRHYDEGGKLCPKYYVENEEEWKHFVEDVKSRMQSEEE